MWQSNGYEIAAFPQNSGGSTSGEVRLAKLFGTEALRNTIYLRLTGRESSIESGGAGVVDIGPGTTTYHHARLPRSRWARPPTCKIGNGRRAWRIAGCGRNVAELTLGIQKVFYGTARCRSPNGS